MKIRKLKVEDLEGLAKIYKGFWNEESCLQDMKLAFNKINEDPNYIVLNAFENKQLVGTIMGIICHELYGKCNPFMVIENFIVEEIYRRKGIGKALLENLENIAKKKRCNNISLVTETFRKKSQKFYESQGYSKGTHKGYKRIIDEVELTIYDRCQVGLQPSSHYLRSKPMHLLWLFFCIFPSLF